jgi:hypothetical protein
MPDPDRQKLEDLVQQRRVEEIYSTRSNILDLEREIATAVANPRVAVSDNSIREAYQLLVQQYVRVVEPVLNPPDRQWMSDYWVDVTIGKYQRPDGSWRVVQGLAQYLDLGTAEPIEVEHQQPATEDEVAGAQTRTRIEYDRPPKQVSEAAFRAANVALTNLGLEIDVFEQSVGPDIIERTPGVGADL